MPVKSEVRLLFILGLLLPALTEAADTLPLPAAREDSIVAQSGSGASRQQTATLPPIAGSAVAESADGAGASAQPQAQIAGMGASIPVETLDQHRGGSSVNSIKSEAVSNGLLQDATATNVATGNNTIADGAFSHAIGLPIVIQNSGANVLIQNSTIVNVQFR